MNLKKKFDSLLQYSILCTTYSVRLHTSTKCTKVYAYLCVRCQVVQGRYVKPEFAGFSELAEASAEAHEVIRSYRARQREYLLRNVVHPVFLLPEAINSIRTIHQDFDVVADTVE